MSWRNSVLLLVMPLLLSACGFQPLYAKKSSTDVSKVFAGVKVDSVSGRSGQIFRSELEDKLNPHGDIPAKPLFRLAATLNNNVVPIGVARDNTVTRYNVYLSSHYILYRIADDKAITSGDITFTNSYGNLTNAYFSTYVSADDAMKRGIVELSELYRLRLAAYLEEGAPEQKIKAEPDKKQLERNLMPYSNTPGAPVMRPY